MNTSRNPQAKSAVSTWVLVLIVMAGFLTANSAMAWGSQGHQVIANLAFARLSPKARLEVNRLLSLEPGETLASISTWADEHRNPSSGPWHYINFPRGSCKYEEPRDCPEGQCVIAAIARQQEVLATSSVDAKRLAALKYIVHFVGDIHQPLHAGYQDDRGGNTYQLQAFMRGSNLHALWDSGLIRNLEEQTDAMSARLSQVSPSPQTVGVTVAAMAEESCRIVASPGFYPDRKVDMAYVKDFTPVLEERLVIAGARLAAILNEAFR